jgi:tripartite-type tricarboxylate transporter receptor subunit TctC
MNAVVLLSALLSPSVATAQSTYPSQPIRFIVPYAAGGLPDVVARIVAQRLPAQLGQPIIVENRPGGNGSIATSTLMSAPADGYTFIVTDGSLISVNPALFASLNYDPKKDFEPVALLARAPLFLASHPSLPVKSLSEFVDYVRKNPGKINYGSSGVGSSHHLTMEAMKAALKLEMEHVPFRGSGQSVPALLGGHVQVLFSAYPSLMGAVEDKRINLLATNGLQRSPMAPDVPPISDVVADFDFSVLVGILARSGTPKDIIAKVSAAAMGVVKMDEVAKQYAAAGIEQTPAGPVEFQQALARETERVTTVIKSSGITIK